MIAEIKDKNKIIVYDLSQFDIYAILHCGQIFRYFNSEGKFTVISGGNWAEIFIENNKAIINCNDSNYFYNFFDFETDYDAIKKYLSKFPKLGEALKFGGGIRILKADFYEIVISFIISANNNIKRFTKTLNLICEKYGTKLDNGYFSFPTLTQLSKANENDFNKLGCGYRSKYLVNTIKQLALIDINLLKNSPTEKLYSELLKLSGVGPKVCSCIMLFTGDFHRLEVAPVDTWIKKAIEQLTANEKNEILTGKYAGIAQQYIFYYLQHLLNEIL